MKLDQLENQNPNVYNKTGERLVTTEEEDDNVVDEFDSREVFGNITSQSIFFVAKIGVFRPHS